MLTQTLAQLIRGEDLTYTQAAQAMTALLHSDSPAQMAAFLVLLRAKGETAEEMAAFVASMQAEAVNLTVTDPVMDIVGTGGDGANTVNISTGASLVAASCGVKVVKHGNKAVSSASGAADVLTALGINIQQTPAQVLHCLEQTSIGFCFAPNFHPLIAHVREVRQALKQPTCFNLLGPLLNPAQANHLLLGVYTSELLPLMAQTLQRLPIKRAMVVHGQGLDELSCLGPCDVIELADGELTHNVLDPQALGLAACTLTDLQGGDAQYNAQRLKAVFAGKASPLADSIVFNAAVAIKLYGLTDSIESAIDLARERIAQGHVMQLVNEYAQLSHQPIEVSHA